MSRNRTPILRRFLLVGLVAAAGGSAYLGWMWLDGLVCRQVAIEGHRFAGEEEILAVARVDTGVRLLDIDPGLIADRVERHPWVHTARVRRLPPESVSIEIAERVPVALAIDASGRPAAYLDAQGYSMPALPEAVFDVPLLQGARLPENVTQPISSDAVSDLLAALDRTDEATNALMSSFRVDGSGEITLQTVPAAGRDGVTVRLGRRNFAEKFVRLSAFWEQAVLSRPELTFDFIDLRFDSQIVTRES